MTDFLLKEKKKRVDDNTVLGNNAVRLGQIGSAVKTFVNVFDHHKTPMTRRLERSSYGHTSLTAKVRKIRH